MLLVSWGKWATEAEGAGGAALYLPVTCGAGTGVQDAGREKRLPGAFACAAAAGRGRGEQWRGHGGTGTAPSWEGEAVGGLMPHVQAPP